MEEDPNPLMVLAAISGLNDYKHVVVNMFGVDGNAFSIMGVVTGALRKDGAPQEVIGAFLDLAMQGTYEELLQACKQVVTVVCIRPPSYRQDALSAFNKHADGVEIED